MPPCGRSAARRQHLGRLATPSRSESTSVSVVAAHAAGEADEDARRGDYARGRCALDADHLTGGDVGEAWRSDSLVLVGRRGAHVDRDGRAVVSLHGEAVGRAARPSRDRLNRAGRSGGRVVAAQLACLVTPPRSGFRCARSRSSSRARRRTGDAKSTSREPDEECRRAQDAEPPT